MTFINPEIPISFLRCLPANILSLIDIISLPGMSPGWWSTCVATRIHLPPFKLSRFNLISVDASGNHVSHVSGNPACPLDAYPPLGYQHSCRHGESENFMDCCFTYGCVQVWALSYLTDGGNEQIQMVRIVLADTRFYFFHFSGDRFRCGGQTGPSSQPQRGSDNVAANWGC